MSRVLNSEEKLAVSMREIQAEETDCAESGEVKEPERYLEEKTVKQKSNVHVMYFVAVYSLTHFLRNQRRQVMVGLFCHGTFLPCI